MNPFLIDLRGLPGDGKHLEGTLPPAFFALAEDDPIRAAGPLTYSLDAQRDGADLIVTGELDATFDLECGRCLQRFQKRIHFPAYTLEVPIENEPTIDLTEAVREDILLALPSYPRCEDGNVTPRACPAEGRFEHEAPADLPQDKGVWDTLDQLKS